MVQQRRSRRRRKDRHRDHDVRPQHLQVLRCVQTLDGRRSRPCQSPGTVEKLSIVEVTETFSKKGREGHLFETQCFERRGGSAHCDEEPYSIPYARSCAKATGRKENAGTPVSVWPPQCTLLRRTTDHVQLMRDKRIQLRTRARIL